MPRAFSPWRAALLVLALSPVVPAAAEACSIVMARQPGPAARIRAARAAVEGASAIVDGEVIRPFLRGRQSALIRAFRVLKGPPQAVFEVGERDSCDIAPVRVGERARFVLAGGPDLYFDAATGADPRDVDRLLRSDRRRDWPYRPGTPAPAE